MEVNLVALAPGGAQLFPSDASVPPAEAAKFKELLSQPAVPTVEPIDPTIVQEPSGVTLGDTILGGFQAIGESYRRHSDTLFKSLQLPVEKLDIRKSLGLQWAVNETTFQLDICNKVVGKVGQLFTDLTKMQ